MPLFGNDSTPRLRSDRPHQGFLFEMTDGSGTPVLVLVTALALEEIDGNRKPPDQFSGRAILDANRRRIEEAASRKFDAQGTKETLEARPVLLVQSMDL